MAITTGFCITLFGMVAILSVNLQSHQVDGKSISSEKDHEIQTSKESNQLHEFTKSLHPRVKRMVTIIRRKQMSSSQGQCDKENKEYKKLESTIKALNLRSQITKWENTVYDKVCFCLNFSLQVYFFF